MAPILYMIPASPPVRAVLMTAKAIGLEFNEKEVNLFEGENRKPEFLKLNPQHSVPTLVDDDFVIWDSHAIMAYLISKYAKNDALYPADLKKRAVINQRLYFESGVVFPALVKAIRPVIFQGKKTFEDRDKEGITEVYGFLDTFLDGKQWVAGDFLSIADYSLISSVSSVNVVFPIDEVKFPKVTAWLKKCQGLPEYEVNETGLKGLSDLLKSKLSI